MKFDVLRERVPLSQHLPVRIFPVNDIEGALILPHFHEDIEIIFISDGMVKISEEEKQIRLESGLHIINSNIVHSTLSEGETRGVLLQISYQYLLGLYPDLVNIDFILPKENDNNITYLEKLLEELLELTEHPKSFSWIEANRILLDIIEILLANFTCKKKKKIKRPQYFERIQEITDYINTHFQERISLNDLADFVHLNPSYLSRFFKKHFGLTFFEYLSNIRIDYASTLLTSTNIPIMKVLEDAGFQNYHQFNKEFMNRLGMTPSQYRKSKTTPLVE